MSTTSPTKVNEATSSACLHDETEAVDEVACAGDPDQDTDESRDEAGLEGS